MWIVRGYRTGKCQNKVFRRMTPSFAFVSSEVSCVIPLISFSDHFDEFQPCQAIYS